MTPTPEERAEKIYLDDSVDCGGDCETDWKALERVIAAEIADAVANEYAKGALDQQKKCQEHIRAAVEEEAQLRMDWNYRIECLEKQLAAAEENKRAAVEEAIKQEQFISHEQETFIKHEASLIGARLAYADAAKIAEQHDRIKVTNMMDLQKKIAEAIRARAAGVTK